MGYYFAIRTIEQEKNTIRHIPGMSYPLIL